MRTTSEESKSKETLDQEPVELKKPNGGFGTNKETTITNDVVLEKLVEVMTKCLDIKKISRCESDFKN